MKRIFIIEDTNVLLVSYIDPFSTQFHAISDFRRKLSTTQKICAAAALIFSTVAATPLLLLGKVFIIPIILLEIAVFRLSTGYFTDSSNKNSESENKPLVDAAAKVQAQDRAKLHKSYTDNPAAPLKSARDQVKRHRLNQPLSIMQCVLSFEELSVLENTIDEATLTTRTKELPPKCLASFWNTLQKKWCGALADQDIESAKRQLALIVENLTEENFKTLLQLDSFWTVVQSQDYSKTMVSHLKPRQLHEMANYVQNVAITTVDPRFTDTIKKVVNAFVNIVGCILPEQSDNDYLLAVIDHAIPSLEKLLKAKIVQASDTKTELITHLERPVFKKSATLELPKTVRRGSVAARKSAFLHALQTDSEMPEKEKQALVEDPQKLALLTRLADALKSFNEEHAEETKKYILANHPQKPYSQRRSTSETFTKTPPKIAPAAKYVVKLSDAFYHNLLNLETFTEISEDFFFWILANTSLQNPSDPLLEKKAALVQHYYSNNTDPDKYRQLALMGENQLQNLSRLLGDKVNLLWEQEKRACGARTGRDLEHIADRVFNEVRFLSLDQLSTSMDAFLFIIRNYPEHVARGLTPDHFGQIAKQTVSADQREALQLLVKKLLKEDTHMEEKLRKIAPHVKDANLKTLVEERAGLLGISKRQEIMGLIQNQ